MKTKPKWRLQDPRSWTIQNTSVEELEATILERRKFGEKPDAVVFDLDGTLFDVSFRTFAILEDWVKRGPPTDFPSEVFARLVSLRMEDIGYSVEDAFHRMGFDTSVAEIAEAYKVVNREWKRHFFDGKTLVLHDKPHPGALGFVRRLHAGGIRVVYLTGRSHYAFREGTQLQLEKAGFSMENSEIILKTDEAMDDCVFKALALSEICKRYSVLANFENEYTNIAAMAAIPKPILHVIVDAPHSSREVPNIPVSVLRLLGFSKYR